ncbi:hypothetical protein CHL67_01115 [Prosthecochloris sp. GSB1]|uniref:hypothetical protein n=1 Tax=Prosthecochloris sp. GSB1 TaxID=281093 RepID=UPI000B8CE57F|nr:hypothetical protein [Prosthecochloris sp. GSB1]ASQ89704.1 hypothetical protein CHL67_01115 [Prosthecochloris sp. GSB1]
MSLQIGDPVIYRKPKSSPRPGPRARQVYALERGESYHYVVDKFWKVSDVNQDGTVDVVTRKGKKHRLQVDDPNLQKAGFLTFLLFRKKFPEA